jgi:hypothetical protein
LPTVEPAKCQTLLQEIFLIIIQFDEWERKKKYLQIKFTHLYVDENQLYIIEKGSEKNGRSLKWMF